MAERKSRPTAKSEVRVNRTVPAQGYAQGSFTIPALKVPAPFQGFINFIREAGVVGLGVGFVVGTSATVLIKSVVTNIINPIVGLLTGGIDLGQKTVCLNTVNGVCKNTLNYGLVISDTITFIAILAVVYFVIKGLKLDKLDKPKPEK